MANHWRQEAEGSCSTQLIKHVITSCDRITIRTISDGRETGQSIVTGWNASRSVACSDCAERMFSNRNARNHQWGSSTVVTDIVSLINSPLTINVKWHPDWPFFIFKNVPRRSDFLSNHDVITDLKISLNYEWFPTSIYNGCGIQTGGDSFSRHLVSSVFGTTICCTSWDQLPRHLVPSHLGLGYAVLVEINTVS